MMPDRFHTCMKRRFARRLSGLSTVLILLVALPASALDRGKQVQLTRKADADQMLATVENAVWAGDGLASDKQVYVVYNTQCPYSQRLYKETRGLTGKLQFRWIPATGNGAEGVTSLRSGDAVADAFAGRRPDPGDAARGRRAVDYNAAVQVSIDFQLRGYDTSTSFAYPTLVYRTAKGVKVVAGNPANLAALPSEVASVPAKATFTPAAIQWTAAPLAVSRSRNLAKWYHDRPGPVVLRAAPSEMSAPMDTLNKDSLLPVSGIVAKDGWIQLTPWKGSNVKVYAHDPLMARMALLEYTVRPQGGVLEAKAAMQVRTFPAPDAPILDSLRPGERFNRSGVVQSAAGAWDEIVMYVDGTKGYVKR
jgi:hypothetical protein